MHLRELLHTHCASAGRSRITRRVHRSRAQRVSTKKRNHDRGVPMAHALTAGRLLLYLQPSIPHLTRSARHRCLQRHGICRAAPHTHAPHRLHGRIQLHTQAKDPQRSHSLRLHLQNLDFRTRSIQLRSEPLNAGTEQLELPIVPQDLWEAAKARQESRINKQTKPTASSRELQLSARSDGWRGRNRAARASSLDWKTNS